MKKAFTLIELLVVIAIIAILAAILFPVFAQAKLAAKKTQALSNCKQVGTGTLIYMNDQDGTYPMGTGIDWYYPSDGGWSWDTQPYIKNLPILRDPSDPLTKVVGYNWQTWFNNQSVLISFASNGFIKWNSTINDNEMAGLMGPMQGHDMKGTVTRTRPGGFTGDWYAGPSAPNESGVSRVSDTIAFASRFGGNNTFSDGDMIGDVVCCPGFEPWGANAIPDGTRNGTPYTITSGSNTILVNKDNRNGAIAAVYANNGIFVFADSHAKAMNPAATNPKGKQGDDTQDTQDMWNARRS